MKEDRRKTPKKVKVGNMLRKKGKITKMRKGRGGKDEPDKSQGKTEEGWDKKKREKAVKGTVITFGKLGM
jgi:hypothetical protein